MGSQKLKVPHPKGEYLTGILQYDGDQPPKNSPVAFILHGVNAHKDQLYHKPLAAQLAAKGLPSFRFDFRGNHESPGVWRQGNLGDDVEDLSVCVEYFQKEYGMWAKLLIGHSRGSITAIIYQCMTGNSVPYFINISGRYRMEKFADLWIPIAKESIDKIGYYPRTYRIAGQEVLRKMTYDDIMDFSRIDLSFAKTRFPQHTNVLTIHGTKDEAVPIKDASMWTEILSKRSPGRHDLYLVEGGTHNFTGKKDEVVEVILTWWGYQQDLPDGRTKFVARL